MDIVEIQDNEREAELTKLFRLKKTNHNRIGIDARLRYRKNVFDFEIKSTTTGSVSSASPLALDHINKWRHQHWIIGIYNKDATLNHCVYGSPEQMKDWLDFWENDIRRGLSISDMLVDRIDKKMVHATFGRKKYYTMEEARFVMKKLYTVQQYIALKDHPNGYTCDRMLEMFKEHNRTYLYRGASLNNPKIPKEYYKDWIRIDSNHAKALRKIIKERVDNGLS